MPYGPGTYGSQVGRPPKKKKKKKLSRGQRMIAGQAGDKLKIESADFAALRRKRGMRWWHTKAKALAEARKVAKATKSSTRSVSLKIGVHKSRSGGLTAAGRRKYNRATGSNLKAPQPEGGPRKRSFCARMSGVKGPMKDSKGRPTRKALALRKWKC